MLDYFMYYDNCIYKKKIKLISLSFTPHNKILVQDTIDPPKRKFWSRHSL